MADAAAGETTEPEIDGGGHAMVARALPLIASQCSRRVVNV